MQLGFNDVKIIIIQIEKKLQSPSYFILSGGHEKYNFSLDTVYYNEDSLPNLLKSSIWSKKT